MEHHTDTLWLKKSQEHEEKKKEIMGRTDRLLFFHTTRTA
jgi:hypothetical protein